MANQYDRFVALAVKLLKKWGMPISLRRELSTLDPATGGVISGPTLEQELVGLFVPNMYRKLLTVDLWPGVVVQANDRTLLVSAKSYDFYPEPGDRVHLPDGRDFDIVGMIPMDPVGTPITYQLLVRR